MSEPTMAETTKPSKPRSVNDLPPMPKATITVYVIAATIVVFGLGMAVGGHEWQRIGLQTGIVLIAGAVALAICTGLMHLAYSAGWKKRGMVVEPTPGSAQDPSTENQGAPTAPAVSAAPTTSGPSDVESASNSPAPVSEPERHVVEASHNGSKVPVGSR